MLKEFAFVLIGTTLASLAQGQANTFPSSGNVGIGTTSPNTSFDLTAAGNGIFTYNSAYNSGVYMTGEAGAYGLIQAVDAGNNTPGNLVLQQYGGKLGIGTVTPAAKLDVGDASGAGSLETVFARLTEGNGTGDGTYLGAKGWCTQPGSPCSLSGSNVLSFSIEHHFYGQTNSSINFYRGGGSTGGFLTLATNNNNERMRIDPSGNVGIGTTAPGYRLDVAGSIHATQPITASGGIVFPDGSSQTTAFNTTLCGGDYAESVDVTGGRTKFEPGDLLVIDPDDPSRFLKSTGPYSSAVAGIYSTKPGAIGRRQTTARSPDEIPMAIVGIVPAKVSAENGPIRPTDLLVSSSMPGYAMKGTDRSKMLGAVVGKAMGSLNSGTGVIEVLVTLQ